MKTAINTTRNVARYQLLSRLLAAATGESLDQLLADVVDVMDLAEAGVRWPIPGVAQAYAVAGPSIADEAPLWSADLVSRLAEARSCEEAFVHPGELHRLLIPLPFAGRRNGVFWAVSDEEIADEDGQLLIVVAQCLSRHPSFVAKMGPVNDPSRIIQRLQDAGSVAGKMAHDLDNIFTGVVGFAEMVQGLLEPGTLPHQYVAEIAAAGNRGIVFTQQLHQMSRCGATRPMPTAVSSVLHREEMRIKKASSLNVKLQFAAPNDLPAVAVESGALQQLLGNILDNAVEASPPGGAVRVSAALIELSELEANEYIGAASAGPFVELRIADDGPGVRDDYRKRLFVEPFFTTKARHRGLGLPVALRILSAHRGGIRYEPGPTRGSVFHVVLPLAAARVPEPGNAPLENTRIPGGNAT